jgi:CheY-like chemotaxis protein
MENAEALGRWRPQTLLRGGKLNDAGTGGSAKALVVEDEPLIRMNTCFMLQEMGVEAVEAGSAEDALLLLAGDSDIDVLIADLGLPGIGGEELVRQARALRPSLRIVVASGRSSRDQVGNPAFEGVFRLGKPFDADDLRRALHTSTGSG